MIIKINISLFINDYLKKNNKIKIKIYIYFINEFKKDRILYSEG